MAVQDAKVTGTANNTGKPDTMAAARAARGKRKSYDYNMQESDKFALRQVQAARSALAKVAVAIQSGKSPSAELVKACSDVINTSASTMFS